MNKVKQVLIENEKIRVNSLLNSLDLNLESTVEKTFYIEYENEIIGTVSIEKNVLKCLAVSQNHQGKNIADTLVSKAVNSIFDNGYDNCLVYTKKQNVNTFVSLGFKLIADTSKVAFLEFNSSITSTLENMKSMYNLNESYASIVVNCNPMTNGHLALIKQCALENDNVIVFVVEEDKSFFKFEDRLNIVQSVCKRFTNVAVIPSTSYIISRATFPTYFIKDQKIIDEVSMELDLVVFKKYFIPIFNITSRYVGTEPHDIVTNSYNYMMKKHLESVVEVKRTMFAGDVISATVVRKLLSENNLTKIKELVPNETYELLLSKYASVFSDN